MVMVAVVGVLVVGVGVGVVVVVVVDDVVVVVRHDATENVAASADDDGGTMVMGMRRRCCTRVGGCMGHTDHRTPECEWVAHRWTADAKFHHRCSTCYWMTMPMSASMGGGPC